MHTPFAIRLVRWGFCIAVVATILAGLYTSGTPANQRRYALDERRVNSLNQISYAIDGYVQTKGTLPPTLTALAQEQPYLSTELSDPATHTLYEYLPTGATTSSYQLCATFDLPSQNLEPARPYTFAPFMTHDAGRVCFTLQARLRTETSTPLEPKPIPLPAN